MSFAIPRKGKIGRFLNPFPFHMKEHASITLMASAASQTALATEALAAQDLFYGGYPSKGAGIFVVITSQLIGFGLAGLLRDVLVYPTHMLWPMNLPITSLLESLHKDKVVAKQRLRIFYIVFFTFLVWEIFPEVSTTILSSEDNSALTCLLVHLHRARGCVGFLPCTSGQPGLYQSLWRCFWKRRPRPRYVLSASLRKGCTY
jgi:hypothetical protein